jgi:SAM-dependent methyltransferase
MSTEIIRADFDRLALLDEEQRSHNSHYHAFLLRYIPPRCGQTLEIGCGTGAFARLLAQRSQQVLALDLSPQMIETAQERSQGYSNITFEVADVLAWKFPRERFDCIASIATLHHLPLEKILEDIRAGLKPGGVLLVLDLFEAQGLAGKLTGAVALPVNAVLNLAHTGHIRESRTVRQAWAEHGRNDTYPTVAYVRRVCDELLPGAIVRKHLLWRYSIIWRKPASGL